MRWKHISNPWRSFWLMQSLSPGGWFVDLRKESASPWGKRPNLPYFNIQDYIWVVKLKCWPGVQGTLAPGKRSYPTSSQRLSPKHTWIPNFTSKASRALSAVFSLSAFWFDAPDSYFLSTYLFGMKLKHIKVICFQNLFSMDRPLGLSWLLGRDGADWLLLI